MTSVTPIAFIFFCSFTLVECHYFSMKYLRHLVPQARIANATITKETAHSLTTCNLKCVNRKPCISNLFFNTKNKCILLRSFFQETQQFGETAQLDNSTKVVVSQSTDPCSLKPCSEAEGSKCFTDPSLGSICVSRGFSCLDMKTQYQNLPSGYYQIWTGPLKNSSATVYCDMTSEGGGWMQVLRLQSDTKNMTEFLEAPFPNWKSLANFVVSRNYMIEPAALADLNLVANFKQFRFKCEMAQSNKVLHLMTHASASGWAVVDWLIGKTVQQPTACGSFKPLTDDNSNLSQRCNEWRDGTNKWGGYSSDMRERFLSHLMFIAGEHHWNLFYNGHTIQNRFECDNLRGETIEKGDIWEIFIR